MILYFSQPLVLLSTMIYLELKTENILYIQFLL